ncbi:MAG: hypothetical protein LBM70_09100 [Victivallales bacterium]|jgi:hypothetical protein|nr:hypothetical protein [Victivallales bacterium]
MPVEFSRSILAQAVAVAMIEVVQKGEYLKGAMIASPVLSESEKELFVKMLARINERRKNGQTSLNEDEIASLFNFVYAKAAEAVTNMVNIQPDNFDLLGMLDGKAPLYADDRLVGHFKKLNLAADCAQGYLDWFAANASNARLLTYDPILPLFEALKWCFRLSCTLAIEKLESDGRKIPGA